MSAPAAKTHRAHPAWVRITASIAGGIILLLLALHLAAPPIARNILEKQLSKNLSTPKVARTAHIDRVRINPLALSCSIEGLAITDGGRAPLVRWRNLCASLDLRTLVTREWRFRKIALDGFAARIAILKDGTLNFSDLAAPVPAPSAPPPRQPSDKSRPLRINDLAVTDAHLDYSDASLPLPFATQIGPMSFHLRDLQTGGPGHAPGEFTAATESGETLAWRGTLSVAPLNTQGTLRIGNLSLKKYTPYYAHHVRFDILDGKAAITLHYDIAAQNNTLTARATQSDITLRNLKLAERNATAPAIAIDTLDISGIAIESETPSLPARQTLRIDRITLDKGAVALRRDNNGLSLAQLFAPDDTSPPLPTPTTTPRPAPPSPPPEITIGELTLRDIILDLEDTTLATPLRAQTTITTLGARNVTLSKLDTPLPLELAARLPGGGHLRATGTLALSPLRGTINAELTDAPLTLARAHLQSALNIRIDAGRATAKATLSIDPAAGLAIAGDATLADFAAADTTANAPLQSWKQLTLRGITYATTPAPALTLREITLDNAVTQLVLQPGGNLNLSTLAKTPAPPPPASEISNLKSEIPPPPVTPGPPTPSAPPAATPLRIAIEKITLANNRIAFTDQTITPVINLSLDALNGTISGLSSENLARADIDLRAKINGAAPVALTGQINPLSDDAYTDLRLTIADAALAPLGPYIGKYAGRTLAAGTLDIDISAKVSQRILDSANIITLDQFALGENTNSPDATNLPIGLAIALLRDRNGKIVLDVPVKGSLDDPEFKYGRAVWRAIGNLLAKAATAPFTLLTSLIGGIATPGNAEPQLGPTDLPQDLSTASFSPGDATPAPETQRKLQLLARALRERPALQLAITGGYTPDTDRAALRNALLLAQLKQEYWANLGGDRDAQTAAADQIELPPDTEPRMIERLYQRKFPIEERNARNAPPAAAAPRLAAAVLPPGAATRAETTNEPLPAQEEMRARLLDTIQVNDDQLRHLATIRAQAIKNHLVNEGIESTRITLADSPATGTLASLELR